MRITLNEVQQSILKTVLEVMIEPTSQAAPGTPLARQVVDQIVGREVEAILAQLRKGKSRVATKKGHPFGYEGGAKQ